MRFLPRSKKINKTILVISDLHLGAGLFVDGLRNPLEDFFFDKELVDFFNYYSSGRYEHQEVELIINGDFLDFLAVPFVPFFDDEFWSESASVEKLKKIMKAHHEVMDALSRFIAQKNKKIVYIIGNHDEELLFEKTKSLFIERITGQLHHERVIMSNELETYNPHPGIYIQHGHQYEKAHDFDPKEVVIKSKKGENYLIPSWGSYYVTHIINKFKQERSYVNCFKPIKNLLFHGLIFDTFFTLRFMFANVYFFLMVRFWYIYMLGKDWGKIKRDIDQELTLFEDYETVTRGFFQRHPLARVLMVGHTHEPTIRDYEDHTTFINTGTWTKMIHLNFDKYHIGHGLTFAKVQIQDLNYKLEDFHQEVQLDLFQWKGSRDLPYTEWH